MPKVIDWKKADWRMRDCEIADLLGVSQAAVSSRRRAVGAPQSPNRYKHRVRPSLLTTFKGVDWKKRDSVIASELGVSRQRVEQVRKLVGAPRSPDHNGCQAILRKIEFLEQNAPRLAGMRWGDVYAILGGTANVAPRKGQVYHHWKRYLAAPKHPWGLLNFSLPNSVLARIWRISPGAVRIERWSKKRPAARWRTNTHGLQQLKAYRAAVQREEKKARRFFEKPTHWKRYIVEHKSNHPWRLLNFSLPSSVLARIWRISLSIVNDRRWREERLAARWRANTHGLQHLKPYRMAIQREEKKARLFFEEHKPNGGSTNRHRTARARMIERTLRNSSESSGLP